MLDKTTLQAQMLANRLQKRFRHLKKWARATARETSLQNARETSLQNAQRTEIGIFRLYDRDIPEIPLILDFYGDLNENSNSDWALSGALYKRPYEKDEADEEQWLAVMKESAACALGISVEHVFIKQRERQRGVSQYERISEKHFEKIVSEGGLSFKVNLSDYLDTGLFPDRRLLRAMVRAESKNKKVLNLFSYTGSFSVYAASGGAVSTDSVDLSNTYLNWARDNFSLNGFSARLLPRMDANEDRPRITRIKRMDANNERINSAKAEGHKLIRADVLDFVDKAVAAKMKWDLIVLDPPAFSNSKRMTENFDLNRDIFRLLGKCLKLLSPSGKIFLSINVRRSAPSASEIEEELKQQTNVCVTDITDKIIDEDFKGKKMPRGFIISLL